MEKEDAYYCPCVLGCGGVGGKEFGMEVCVVGGDLVILDGGNWGGIRREVIYGMAEEIGTA